MTYHGKNNVTYTLGSKIGGGGEGDVYSIVGNPNLLAKIYRQNHFSSCSDRHEMQQKIDAMLSFNISAYKNNHLVVAWPTDTLCDSTGEFYGYVMPKAPTKLPILCAFIPTERERLFPNYSWRYAPRIAYNLAVSVALLHEKIGITLGDMNTENFLIDDKGYITLIDTDSFNITHNGHCYKCKAGVPDMLPPELQGKDLSLSSTQFTRETDCFSLAVLIFQILVNGVHPFGMPNNATAGQSSGRNAVVSNIVTGYCPYITGSTEKRNVESPNMVMFPRYIRDLFDRAFNYSAATAIKRETISKRPSAHEWVIALDRLRREKLKFCSNKGSRHEYPESYSGPCPWCEIEKKLGKFIPPKQYLPHQTNPITGVNANPTNSPTTNIQSANPQAQSTNTVIKREAMPLYLLYPSVGCLGTVLMASAFSDFSQNMDVVSMSDNTACVVLAIIGAIVGIILTMLVADHYTKSDTPGLWIALCLVIPIVAYLCAAILLVGFYVALAALVLGLICYIFASM